MKLSFRDMVDNPVPRRLAQRARQVPLPLDERKVSKMPTPAVELMNSEGPRRSFASSMQKGFCLAQDVFKDATYKIPGLFKVENIGISIPKRLWKWSMLLSWSTQSSGRIKFHPTKDTSRS